MKPPHNPTGVFFYGTALPGEVCFPDCKVMPVPEKDFGAWGKRQRPELAQMTYAEHCAYRRRLPVREDYVLFAIRSQNGGDLRPLMMDCDRYIWLARDCGLFREIAIRAAVAHGLSPDEPSPICADMRGPNPLKTTFPTHFATYSSKDGRLQLLRWEQRNPEFFFRER
jgi:hypothetical protein